MEYIIRDIEGIMIAKVTEQVKNLLLTQGGYKSTCDRYITFIEDNVFSLGGVRLYLWKGFKLYLK